MLISGFGNFTTLGKFTLGALAGGLISLPVQMGVGYMLRGNGKQVAAVAGAMYSYVLLGPSLIAIGTSLKLGIGRIWKAWSDEGEVNTSG